MALLALGNVGESLKSLMGAAALEPDNTQYRQSLETAMKQSKIMMGMGPDPDDLSKTHYSQNFETLLSQDTPYFNRFDVERLLPEFYPRTLNDVKIVKRLAEKSAPTPAHSFFGSNAAVYLAEVPPAHQIALKLVYSFGPDQADQHLQEVELHKFICEVPGSERYIVRFYTHWQENPDFSRLPDFDADLSSEEQISTGCL